MTEIEQVLRRFPLAALSHETAARALGIELVDDAGRCRLTVPRNASRVVLPGWDVLRRDLLVRERRFVAGAAVTSPARTLVDLCSVLPVDEAVAAADSALRRKLVTLAVLADALTAKRGPAPDTRRTVARMLDPKAGSVLESLFRVLVRSAGLPAPTSQLFVPLVGRVDFAWVAQRVVVELDGFAFHSDREAYRRDRQRMNELERQGWRVLRFTWEDVRSRSHYVVAVLQEVLALAA